MLELSQMKKFCQMQMIRKGQAFSKFNHESPSKQEQMPLLPEQPTVVAEQ